MNSQKNKYDSVRSLALYGLAIALVSGSNFLIAPVLVRLLGEAEFGQWSLLEPIILAAIPLTGLGIHIGLIREIKSDSTADAATISSLFPFYIISSGFVALVTTGLVVKLGLSFKLAIFSGATVLVEGVLVFCSSLWRAQSRPIFYAIVEGGRAATIILLLALALAISPFLADQTEDYLTVRVAIALCALIGAMLVIKPGWRPSLQRARIAISYGAPIVAASMCSVLMVNVDRFALAQSGRTVDIASYVAHVKIAQVLTTAVAPFFIWFAPKAIQRLEVEQYNPQFFIKTTSIYVCVVIWASANLWIVSPTIWTYLFPTISLDPSLLASLIVGTAIYSIGNPVSIGTLRARKTHFALLITLGSLVVGAIASFYLSYTLGSAGAALGRNIGLLFYVAAFAVHTTYSLRLYYPWWSFALVASVTIGLCIGSEAVWAEDHWYKTGAMFLIVNTLFFCILVYSIWCKRWLGARQINEG